MFHWYIELSALKQCKHRKEGYIKLVLVDVWSFSRSADRIKMQIYHFYFRIYCYCGQADRLWFISVSWP